MNPEPVEPIEPVEAIEPIEPIEPATADEPAQALKLVCEALNDGDLEAAVALYGPRRPWPWRRRPFSGPTPCAGRCASSWILDCPSKWR